jgi:hypothetical protein
MKAAIAKRWVKALRSGKYKQTTCRLCIEDEDGNKEYCCLGVLAELRGVRYSGNNGGLTDACRRWAGMKSPMGAFESKDISLAGLNDYKGWGFKKIASFIEKHYKDL